MKRMLMALCALLPLFAFPAMAAACGCGAVSSCGAIGSCGYVPCCPPCVILPITPIADVPVTGGAGLLAWLLLLGGAALCCTAGKNRPV